MAKEWIVIDSRNHFTPKKTADSASQADGTDYQAIRKKRAAGLEKTHDIEYRLPLMDEAGVDMALLNTSSGSPQGIEMCQ